MPTYQLQIKQVVDYPRCRIYRQFVRFLMEDRSIRVYSVFLLLKMALLKKIHQKAQDLQKFGRHLLYIGRTDMAWDSVAGLHALFVP